MNEDYEQRVLVLAPTAKDSEMIATVFRQQGMNPKICQHIIELCEELARGGAVLVVSQEALISDQGNYLRGVLKAQEPWSDIPILVLTPSGVDNMLTLQQLKEIGHMTLIKRPVQMNNFLTTIEAGIRDRTRQYRAREYLEERNRRSEELAAAALKANAASIAKTEFLASMSHEIRTPMNAIIGLTHILRKSSPLSLTQIKYIETLRSSGESLLMLINDVLDISKIEASAIDLEEKWFSLEDLLKDIVEMLELRAQANNLALTLDTSNLPKSEFLGDPTRIRQIIINLCSNAIRFTKSGGVLVSARAQLALDDIYQIHIDVTDTGIGIAPDKLKLIFKKFTQADNTINRNFGGTGLGLAISRTLAELMDGDVSVTSDLGKGSTFTLSLKLKAQARAIVRLIDKATEMNAMRTDRGCVLLVEDYQPNVLVAQTLLEMAGYSCDVAENGSEAVKKAIAGNYYAILMDIQMPIMNGLEATIAIRDHELKAQSARVPIIGMTAFAFDEDRDRCFSAGMDDYISKPFAPADLEHKLETLHQQYVQSMGSV